MERCDRQTAKFQEVVEFIDLSMQTAINSNYDYTKSMDENLKTYKD